MVAGILTFHLEERKWWIYKKCHIYNVLRFRDVHSLYYMKVITKKNFVAILYEPVVITCQLF
jgi:hypothetical protein